MCIRDRYEANKDNLRSIAIYNHYGSLLAAEPVASQKEDPDVTQQDWYIQALDEVENMHFSTPHIQNLFDDGTQHYYWVTSLSRMIEITDSGVSNWGVLLVDMDYADISRMMNQINTCLLYTSQFSVNMKLKRMRETLFFLS